MGQPNTEEETNPLDSEEGTTEAETAPEAEAAETEDEQPES